MAQASLAHEILPSIGVMREAGGRLEFRLEVNLERFIAEIDAAAAHSDTSAAPQSADYDALRRLEPTALAARFQEFWPDMAPEITIALDGALVPPRFDGLGVAEIGDPGEPRATELLFSVAVPNGASIVEFSWASEFGVLVLRQQGVARPYDGYLDPGESTGPIALLGGGQPSGWQVFFGYISVGFDHIVPKGVDHIYFVLCLFFLAPGLRPLLWQVSAFTAAHTISLGLSASGVVSFPASVVEPLIAASIVFVAVENLLFTGLTPWRPVIVFGFGLLHGLGFASVLGEFGLPEGAFVPALLGFNIGVEFGQLAVLAVAYLILMRYFDRPWYRRRIAVPISVGIAAIGLLWVIERTLL